MEQSIADWRQQMAAGGINSPEALDELECHLREDMARCASSGLESQAAFDAAVLQIGQAGALKHEFDKVGETAAERTKRAVLTLAGIPNHHLDTSMNAPYPNIEPRWATYVKTGVYLLPAFLFWVFATQYLFPKVMWMKADAGARLNGAGGNLFFSLFDNVQWVTQFVLRNGVFICSGIILVLGFLEWRSARWSRYRRASFGVGVFLANTFIFLSIIVMFTMAILVAPR